MRVASIVPSLELLYTSEFDLGPAVDAGVSVRGLRRLVPITGGRFEGPRLSGTVLPGGADWQIVRMDGVLEVAASYVLQAASGTKVVVKNTGILKAPGAVLGALAVGDVPDPTSYYFRTQPTFETGDEELAWLNRTVAVGVAEIGRNQVIVTVYRVT
jgi:hypothetical protein